MRRLLLLIAAVIIGYWIWINPAGAASATHGLAVGILRALSAFGVFLSSLLGGQHA